MEKIKALVCKLVNFSFAEAFYAQDISQKSSKMLKLNLILNGIISSLPNIIQGDTLLEPSHFDPYNSNKLRKFDFVVSYQQFLL
ncbi:N-6 DNA methylase [Mycoplasmopsis bovis]|uniref:N-6 DNA methylase n=1 Tax=Mycoplasmopsis bovis TaxID=28903 RepID=UPI003D2D7FD1